MSRILTIYVFLFVLTGFVFTTAFASEYDDVSGILKGLNSDDIVETKKADKDFAVLRNQVIEIYIDKVKQGKTQNDIIDPRPFIVESLGNLRAVKAISVLSDNILIAPSPIGSVRSIHDINNYPSAIALVKIGNPSISAMVGNIIYNGDAKVREVSAWVILMILSGISNQVVQTGGMDTWDQAYDLGVKMCKTLLQEKISNETANPKAVKRLNEAIEFCENYQARYL